VASAHAYKSIKRKTGGIVNTKSIAALFLKSFDCQVPNSLFCAAVIEYSLSFKMWKSSIVKIFNLKYHGIYPLEAFSGGK
jgi:hypothetical protein